MKQILLLPALLAAALSQVWSAPDASWPQFRGPNGQGVAVGARLPDDFGADKNAWAVAVPPGHSSPVVWGDRIFITGIEADQASLMCLSAVDGRMMWRASVPGELADNVHRTSSAVAATPVTDGQRVYGYFPGFGMLAWSMEGAEVWRRPLDVPFVVNGSGTSPVIAEGKLILCVDSQGGGSFVMAMDPATGRTLWRTVRPSAVSNYTTPVLWKRGDLIDLVVSGNLQATGYSLADGAERWTVGGLEAVSVSPSPVVSEGSVYLMSRSLGGGAGLPPQFESLLLAADADKDGQLSFEEAVPLQGDGAFSFVDRDRDRFVTAEELAAAAAYLRRADFGLFAVRDPGNQTGDLTDSHVPWRHKKGIAKVTTPLLLDGRLIVVQDGGMVTASEASSGRIVFERERLGPDGGGDYFASPISDGRRLCFASLRGVVTIAEIGEALTLVHQTKLDGPIAATPALVGPWLYVRAGEKLYAFGEPGQQPAKQP
ncbi:MAG: PQQ-binding-like beta-propeller repeat protein [Verrucomicrobiales bacterium]